MSDLCCWCERPLPKKPVVAEGSRYCGTSCATDRSANAWPAWVTGRIGAEPHRDWHMSGGYLCLSAPNRYRQIYRRHGVPHMQQEEIVALQRAEFPWLDNPMGLDFDAGPDGAVMASWDQVLIWKGPTVADAVQRRP